MQLSCIGPTSTSSSISKHMGLITECEELQSSGPGQSREP